MANRRPTGWIRIGNTGTVAPGAGTTVETTLPVETAGLTLVRVLLDVWWSNNAVQAARTIAGPLTIGLMLHDQNFTSGFPNVTDDVETRWILTHQGFVIEGLAGSTSGAQYRGYDVGTMRKLRSENERLHITYHNGDGTDTIRFGYLVSMLFKLP